MTFTLFAFRHGDDEGEHDLHRHGLPAHRREEAVAWAFERGADAVLIQRSDDPPSSAGGVTHHTCSDPKCPGGCDERRA